MKVTIEEDIPKIAHFLHDAIVDIDSFVVDTKRGTLAFAGQLLRKGSRPIVLRRGGAYYRPFSATIQGVEEFRCEDQANIGLFNIVKFSYQPLSSSLCIEGGVPVQCHIRVSRIDIEVVTSDT